MRARFKFDPESSSLAFKVLDGEVFEIEGVAINYPDGDKLMLASHDFLANKVNDYGRFYLWESCLEYLTES